MAALGVPGNARVVSLLIAAKVGVPGGVRGLVMSIFTFKIPRRPPDGPKRGRKGVTVDLDFRGVTVTGFGAVRRPHFDAHDAPQDALETPLVLPKGEGLSVTISLHFFAPTPKGQGLSVTISLHSLAPRP